VATTQWATLRRRKKKKKRSEGNSASTLEQNEEQPPTQPRHWLGPMVSLADDVRKKLSGQTAPATIDLIPSGQFERTFSREDKATLGTNAKMLLDFCRVRVELTWLRLLCM